MSRLTWPWTASYMEHWSVSLVLSRTLFQVQLVPLVSWFSHWLLGKVLFADLHLLRNVHRNAGWHDAWPCVSVESEHDWNGKSHCPGHSHVPICPHGTWKSKSKEIGNCVWHGAMTELLIIVANLWTDISNLHTRHWLVRLQVTDLDHEVVNAQVPSIHNQTCIDNGIVGSPDKLWTLHV